MPTPAARREHRTLLNQARQTQTFKTPCSWIRDDMPHTLADLGLSWEPWPAIRAERALPGVIRVGRGVRLPSPHPRR